MSTAGIELSVIEDEGGDIKVVDENNETDVPRKSKSLQARHRISTPEMLEKLHELMKLRIYRANMLVLFCLPCAITCFVLSDSVFKGKNMFIKYLTYIFGFAGFVGYFALAYRNSSFVIFKRLMYQVNVCLIIIYSICNLLIDIFVPKSGSSFIYGTLYFLLIFAYLFFDCIEIKSRKLVLFSGFLFTILSLYNLYQNLIGGSDIGVVLITISGNIIYKRTIKSFLFMSISMLAWRGVWILIRDTKMKSFMFIYANYLAIKIDPITESQRTIRTDISVDIRLQKRVKIGGWILITASCIGAPSFAINTLAYDTHSMVLFVITLTFSVFAIIGAIMHAVGNLSLIALKILLWRPSILFLIFFCILNLVIDCTYPYNAYSPINGCLYMIAVFIVVSLDLMEYKQRAIVILLSSLLFLLSTVNIINHTFIPDEDGKQEVNVFGRTFLKANIKRTIFKQILTLSLRGFYVLCLDKKMKYLAFGSKRMNRSTGTSRNSVVRVSFQKNRSFEVRARLRVLSDDNSNAVRSNNKNRNTWANSNTNTYSEDDAKTPSQKNLLMEDGNGKFYKS